MKRLLKELTVLLISVFLYHGNLSGQADFEQTDDEDGLVIMEAEDFSDERLASDGSSWEIVNEPAGFFGTGAVQATHESGTDFTDHKDMAHAQENAPVLMYTVNFVKAEPVYVWARTIHVDGYDDSVWTGLDGTIVGTSGQSLTYLTTEQEFTDWYYINHGMDEARCVIEIPSIGEHTFELYYRETNLYIDQIILTTNSEYDPNAAAPSAIETITGTEAFGIFPNPATGSATINYSIKEAGYVSITIFNTNGQVIETLTNNLHLAGDYTIDFKTEGLSGGLYFYQIRAEWYSKTGKFIIQ